MQSEVIKQVCKPEAVKNFKNFLMKALWDEHVRLCESVCWAAFLDKQKEET